MVALADICAEKSCGSDLALTPLPVLVAQDSLEELAALGAGQLVAELPRAGVLVARETLGRVLLELGEVDLAAGLGLHDRMDLLAPLVVGNAEDGHIHDVGVGV